VYFYLKDEFEWLLGISYWFQEARKRTAKRKVNRQPRRAARDCITVRGTKPQNTWRMSVAN